MHRRAYVSTGVRSRRAAAIKNSSMLKAGSVAVRKLEREFVTMEWF